MVFARNQAPGATAGRSAHHLGYRYTIWKRHVAHIVDGIVQSRRLELVEPESWVFDRPVFAAGNAVRAPWSRACRYMYLKSLDQGAGGVGEPDSVAAESQAVAQDATTEGLQHQAWELMEEWLSRSLAADRVFLQDIR